MPDTYDVLIVGAGAAGLAALRELDRAGLRVCCLEAQDRIGGRILTIHDPLSAAPVELGAEFVHGRAPQILAIAAQAGLTVVERSWNALQMDQGKPVQSHAMGDAIGQAMSAMEPAAASGPDETAASFIARSDLPDAVQRRAIRYVEGFNAADANIIGIASLAQDGKASEQIDGDRSFYIVNGYDAVPLALIRGIAELDEKLRLSTIVERIEWKPGAATVHTRSTIDGHAEAFSAHRVVVTVPLGVLQANPDNQGAIRFDPEPTEILTTARTLAFGNAYRVTLRLAKSFWQRCPEIADAGFIFSMQPVFPTWWRPNPVDSPLITGWCAGRAATPLISQARAAVIAHAIQSLEQISGVSPLPVLAAHFHDWQADPFSRGAYSYVPAGKLAARQILARPVDNTLYFVGEATELEGHSATVHGAIASGIRAAHQVIAP